MMTTPHRGGHHAIGLLLLCLVFPLVLLVVGFYALLDFKRRLLVFFGGGS